MPNSNPMKCIKIYNLKLYFILEHFKCLLRTFCAEFWILGVKSEHFSKIWQIYLETNSNGLGSPEHSLAKIFEAKSCPRYSLILEAKSDL